MCESAILVEPSRVPVGPPASLSFVYGVWSGMVAKTLVELRIPDYLADGEKTLGELAEASSMQPDLLYRLLRATASCNLICSVSSVNDPLEKSSLHIVEGKAF